MRPTSSKINGVLFSRMRTTVRRCPDTVASTAQRQSGAGVAHAGPVDNSNPNMGVRPIVHVMTYRMGPYHALEDRPGHRSMAVQTWHAQDGRSGHDVALSVIENVPVDVTHRMVELSA